MNWSDNKTFIVYKYTLKGTDKVYIGQTCMTIAQRAGSQGHRYKNCTKFYNAIQEFGWDNFECEILAENLTLEEANKLEDEYILKYNSIENGFNKNRGGWNHLWTEGQRQQMRERNLGEKNPNYGKPRSEETKKKIGEANKIALLGRKHTQEELEKMSQSHKKYIPILCIETGIVYNCPSDAAIGVGKSSKAGGHITEVCQGKRNTAYGYHWQYLEKDKIKGENNNE